MGYIAYKKIYFGEQLRRKILAGDSLNEVLAWIYNFCLKHVASLDGDFADFLMVLSASEDNNTWDILPDNLLKIADSLINNDLVDAYKYHKVFMNKYIDITSAEAEKLRSTDICKYESKHLGAELTQKLQAREEVDNIAEWAQNFLLDISDKTDLHHSILTLTVICDKSKFNKPYEKLNQVALDLIDNKNITINFMYKYGA